jgi:flagellar FliL protein
MAFVLQSTFRRNALTGACRPADVSLIPDRNITELGGHSMSKKVLIIVIALAVVLVGLFGAGFFMMWNKMNAMQTAVPAAENGGAETTETAAMGVMYPLNTFIVNLADKGGNRYLRTTIHLELGATMTVEEMDKRLAIIRDKILMILPSKSFADISGPDGKTAIREEILAALNETLGEEAIANLYFTELVIQ